MKSLLSISIFSLLSIPCISQDIRHGVWNINGHIITRPNDSIQIEEHNGLTDTLQIEWLSEKKYRLTKSGRPTLTVFITKTYKSGSYSGTITDGKKEKYFELIKIR